jgi:ATP synthase mitochondrial F1 complex assembly factor 1
MLTSISEGHENVDSLKAAYADKVSALRKSASIPGVAKPLDSQPRPTAPDEQPSYRGPVPPPAQPAGAAAKSTSEASQALGVKTLSSFLDVDKTRTLPAQEIEALWRLRHAHSPTSLCAAIPTSTWGTIHANALRHPQFILPLPREGQEGAEIHFLQWTFPRPDTVTVLFTNLAEYKLRGEYASPHTTVTHHLELVGDKGVVLAQGQVVEGRGVSVEEGKWLFMCLQKFYGLQGEQSETRRRLLDQFSKGDGGFKVEELLKEAEKAG